MVRLNPGRSREVREHIKVAKLLKRLQEHALTDLQMTQTQVDAAKFLLNKKIPNPPTKSEISASLTVNWPLAKGALDV